MENSYPRLFGLKKTNRDFSQKETWGKNQFNSSFPAALCCYLSSKKLKANYLSINKEKFFIGEINIAKVFGIHPTNKDIYFAFESQHTPYQKYVFGTLPRTDLVIQRESTGECLAGLEIKLTALPDNTTCDQNDTLYGSEIVVRPDSIVYLACSIALNLGKTLHTLLPTIEISDWTEASQVLKKIGEIISAIENLSKKIEENQKPFLLQPIWKTKGKTPELSQNCLDIFVWSDAGFVNFIASIANKNSNAPAVTRQTRTAIWLYKMLLDIKLNGKFSHEKIIDTLSFNTKNDKAFASSGNITNKFMTCNRLTMPIIKKEEIKHIILGGGQHLLSPERRFDAILFNSPDLFL